MTCRLVSTQARVSTTSGHSTSATVLDSSMVDAARSVSLTNPVFIELILRQTSIRHGLMYTLS